MRHFRVLFFIVTAFSMLFAGCKKDDTVDLTGTAELPEDATYSVYIGDISTTRVLETGTDYYYEDGDYYEDEEYYDGEEDYEDDEATPRIVSGSETYLGKPSHLYLVFDYGTQSPNIDQDMLNKGLVKLSPAIDGRWEAANGGDRIYFYPAKDWPAGTKYTVNIDKKLLPADYKLSSYTYSFETPAFEGDIQSFNIYQSPVADGGEFSAPYGIATVYFTHQVDEDSVKNGISLLYDNKKTDVTVTFDNTSRYAYIQSSPLTLGEKAGLLTLALKNVKEQLGGATLSELGPLSVDVPAMSDFFKVNEVFVGLAQNDENEPEQVFTIDMTLPVAASELARKVVVYKLPREYDGGKNYNWRNHNEAITLEELNSFGVVHLNFMDETGAPNVQGARFFVDPAENVQLGVLIPKGLESRNDFKLGDNYFRILDVPRFPSMLNIMQDGNVLSLGGDQSLAFVSRAVDKVDFRIARVMPDRLNHLISQTGGDMKDAQFQYEYMFSEVDISTIYDESRTLRGAPNKLNYFSLDLSPYLQQQGNAGIFIMTATAYYNDRAVAEVKRLVQVSDLGLMLKTNLDTSREMYVMNMRSGAPIANARVYYLTRNGMPMHTSYTDINGVAKLPDYYSNKPESVPVAVVTEVGADYSFLPIYRTASVYYGRFSVGGEYTNPSDESNQVKSYLFTERGIYRPGDKVYIGMIAKQDNWESLEGVPMELVITNPRGQEVLRHRFSMDKNGFAEVEFQTDYASPTGMYNMSFSVLKDDSTGKYWFHNQTGTRSFMVQEFKPDTMKIGLTIKGSNAKGWMPLEGLSAEVNLKNLYGTPAQNRRVRWSYSLSPANFHFSAYADYTFPDPYRTGNVRSSGLLNLPDGETDLEGLATGALRLENFGAGLYGLNVQAEGFEDGSGTSVSAMTSALVSPLKSLVGYKYNNGDISYLKKDASASVKFIAIDPELEMIAHDGMRAQIIEQKYVSLLVKQRDGTYVFQSVPRENVVKAEDFDISAIGTDYALPTDKPGTYRLEIQDKNDLLLAKLSFFVSGDTNLTMSMEKNTELAVKLDKAEYNAGDEIELSIISPYTGSGVITIERDRVYARKWFTTNTTASTQRITIPAGMEGNGYVNVSFLRNPDSREILSNPYTYAVAPFNINRAAHTVPVKLSVPELAKPGEPLTIEYTAEKDAKIVVYAVDEGILQVSSYVLPNPLSSFMNKKALQVDTLQNLNMLLSDARAVLDAAGVGGDYAEMMDAAMAPESSRKAMAAGLNPFARKVEAPIAYWSGILEAKAGVTGKTVYNVPGYFNGSLKVMAVAVAQEAVGTASAQMLVKAPIIVNPAMPVTFAPGDKGGVSVVVSNNIEGTSDTEITVHIEPNEYLEVIGENTKTITLSEGNEGRLDFEVKALEKLGGAELLFTATAAGHADSKVFQSATASVRPATAYTTVLTTGVSDRKDVTIRDFSRDMRPEFESRQVTASHNPLLIARGLSAYLVDYPHGCTEQVLSQSFPSLYLKGAEGSGLLSDKQAEEYFKRALDVLRSRQLSNGAFTLWAGGWYNPHDYSTIYAAHYLTDAKAQGYYVPQDILDNALNWIDNYIDNKPKSLYDARLKAYGAYVLTRNGITTTAFVTNLEESLNTMAEKDKKLSWKDDLVVVYMAAIYKQLQMDEKALELVNGFKPDMEKSFIFYSDFDTSSLRNATYLYIMGKHFADNLENIDVEIILNLMNAISDRHYSSILASYSILALYALADATEGEDEGMKILMDRLEQKGMELDVDFTGYPTAKYDTVADRLTAETAEPGTMGFFIVATEKGYDRELPDAVANGIEISREYLDENGHVKTEFKQGDDVTVRVRIRTNGTMSVIENVAITDLLPGALELQNDAMGELQRNTYSSSYDGRLFDYVDVREDRVIFYATVSSNTKTISYRARVVSKGDFVVPPAYAESMYDPVFRGNTGHAQLTVAE